MTDNHNDNQNHDNREALHGITFADNDAAQDETQHEEAKPNLNLLNDEDLWVAAAQAAPSVEDLEFSKMELEEAEQKLEEQRRDHQLAVISRVYVYGRAAVSKQLDLSRKALAVWEATLSPEGEDLSGYYEELRRNQEREARRAERAAQKAAEEAASLQRILDKINNR